MTLLAKDMEMGSIKVGPMNSAMSREQMVKQQLGLRSRRYINNNNIQGGGLGGVNINNNNVQDDGFGAANINNNNVQDDGLGGANMNNNNVGEFDDFNDDVERK